MGRRQELEKKQSLLARFGTSIASENRLESLLSRIAQQVCQVLNADRCSVFLIDQNKGELWTTVALGMEEKIFRMPIGQGVAGQVAKTGNAISLKDAYRDTRFREDLDRIINYKTRAVLAVPLKNREGKVSGVLEVVNKIRGTFTEEDEGLLSILSTMAASFIENATLYEELRKSHLETIYRMALVAEFRDQKDTAKHLRRMSRFSEILALAMGFSHQEAEDLRYAAPLHDIGKVAIPDSILRKPGQLTPEEYEEMKKHTVYGSKMLANAESKLLRIASKIAVAHHERYDGSGYPYGLKGEEIPLEARIVSVADVFDALVSERVYKGAWTLENAKQYIKAHERKLFDPAVVSAFFKSFHALVIAMEEENNRMGLEGEMGAVLVSPPPHQDRRNRSKGLDHK